VVDCAALPEPCWKRAVRARGRAYTGADRKAAGLFAEADGGTFSSTRSATCRCAPIQAAALPADEGISPGGWIAADAVDVRVVAATNRELERRCASGSGRISSTGSTYFRSAFLPCAIGARTCRCSRTISFAGGRRKGRQPADRRVHARGLAALARTTGRATCGSWRTSSGAWWSYRGPRIGVNECHAVLGEPTATVSPAATSSHSTRPGPNAGQIRKGVPGKPAAATGTTWPRPRAARTRSQNLWLKLNGTGSPARL